MFKRISVAAISALVVLSFILLGSTPILKGYSENHVAYLTNSSSNIKVVKLSNGSFPIINGVRGESCTFTADGFDVDEFFSHHGATHILTERTGLGVSYYAFSPEIKYKERVSGKEVNLHVAVYGERITIGTPIIYGSF